MADKIRIGEVLLRRDWIDPIVLSNALKEQRSTQQRLLSLLVSRALLPPDDAVTALSEQLGVPAAMERHLERRDQAALAMIPPEVGQRWVVLPLLVAHTGQLIVAARDPSPILGKALEHMIQRPVVLAVALGTQIERLVRATYGDPSVSDVTPVDLPPAQIGVVFEDTPVPRRARSISDIILDAAPELPRTRSRELAKKDIDGVLDEIDRAITLGAVERLAMAFAQRRWKSALLVRVADGAAFGYRGHGDQLGDVESIVLPLAAPSTLKVARETASATQFAPTSPTQDKLARLLGTARLSAAPVTVEKRVEAVLVVGDPVLGDAREAFADLDRLADALGAARGRFGR